MAVERAAGVAPLLAARRLSGREAFHRHVFETLLAGAWRQQDLQLTQDEGAALQSVLTRWVVEAPANDEHGLLRLRAVRRGLRQLLLATGRQPRPFLIEALSIAVDDLAQPGRLPGWKRAKLAALADASLLTPAALDEWQAIDAAQARTAAIASLDVCPLDAALAAATVRVGTWLIRQPVIELPARQLDLLQDCAFLVSYVDAPERHAFKRAIVQHAARIVQTHQRPLIPGLRSANQRPRLTVVAELMFPQHAMFRCYADVMAGLLAHFDVTLVADAPTRCPEHAGFSHRQLYFSPNERDVGRLADLVRSTSPDIVLYPSVGMSFWSFTLSLLRLAPLQLMSVGHPAPSCSEAIDGTLLYRELAGAPLPEYGRLLAYDRQPLPKAPAVRATPRAAGAPVIAVNAAGMKLNPGFLGVVQQVLHGAPAGTQLHFFPNMSGAALGSLRRELQAWFPDATVHASCDYAQYMAKLSVADLLLQSFPFGGTNTAIDALSLGIPMMCLRSADLPALVDPVLLAHAGLGELCAVSSEDYVRRAVRLLNDPAALAEQRGRLQGAIERLQGQAASGAQSMADAVLAAWQALES